MEASGSGCPGVCRAERGQVERNPHEGTAPPSGTSSEEPPRIGVFVCNCGINIGGVVDVPAVREYARTLPNVIHVEDNLFTCSQDTQVRMGGGHQGKGHQPHGGGRLYFRSPHEPLFRENAPRHRVEQVPFRDGQYPQPRIPGSHMNDRAKATDKAKDLVRMSVGQGLAPEAFEREGGWKSGSGGLVIGGGVAGLTAALNLAEQGFDAVLVEKEKTLGGLARRIAHTDRRSGGAALPGPTHHRRDRLQADSGPDGCADGFL